MKEIINILDTLLELTGCSLEGFTNIRKQINDELSNVDLEKSDMEHYIENSKLNAYDGYHAYVMLRCILQKRREIKIRQSICNSIWGSRSLLSDASKLHKELQTIVTRNEVGRYKPRVLLDLDYVKK